MAVMDPIYLDHAATTPIVAPARAAMLAALDRTGNASSVHAAGRGARQLVEEGRESIAAELGVHPSEVVFTSGGTESDNLAVAGLFWHRRAGDDRRRRILISAIEHHAVLHPARALAQRSGAEVVLLPVDAFGRVSVPALADELAQHADETALISVQWANGEVGTIQPIADIAAVAAEYDVPVHTDAVQAAGVLDLSIPSGTLVTVSGHKLGGPIGVGALIVPRSVTLPPILHGGGQERGIRSGTLNVPGISGFAAAMTAAADARRTGAVTELAHRRDRLVADVLSAVPGATLRGPDPVTDPELRLPGNAFFTIAGATGDSLLLLLDDLGIECSTGSACQAGIPQPSHVLLAMGVDEIAARGALRLTLATSTTDAELGRVIEVLPGVVARAQAAGVVS